MGNIAYFGVRQMVESLLVGRVGLLKVIHHQIAVSWAVLDKIRADFDKRRRLTETTPDITVGGVNLQNGAQVFHGMRELVARAQNACHSLHGGYRPLVVLQGLLVALHRAIEISHLLRQRAWEGSVTLMQEESREACLPICVQTDSVMDERCWAGFTNCWGWPLGPGWCGGMPAVGDC